MDSKTLKLDEVVLVKPSSWTKEQAADFAKKSQKVVIYLEDWESISSESLEEVEKIIADAKKKYEN